MGWLLFVLAVFAYFTTVGLVIAPLNKYLNSINETDMLAESLLVAVIWPITLPIMLGIFISMKFMNKDGDVSK